MPKSRDNKKDLLNNMMYNFGEKELSEVFLDAVRLLSSWESARDMPDLVLKSISRLMCIEQFIGDAIKNRQGNGL